MGKYLENDGIAVRSYEDACALSKILLDNGNAVMITEEEELFIVNWVWCDSGYPDRNDVVSREDYKGLELVCKNYEEALKDAVDELEESDRKRGKIIINEFGSESCSVCHCGLVLFITDENNALIKPNFCPNCGAEMKQE